MDGSPEKGSITERQASQVLERAAQIDAQGDGHVDVDELRRVALDAGIPVDAFDRALQEIRAGVPDAAPAGSQSGPSSAPTLPKQPIAGLGTVLRRAALGVGGFGLGMIALLMLMLGIDFDAGLGFSLILSFFTAIGLVVSRRKERSIIGFEFDLAALWVGLTFAFMLIDAGDAFGVLAGMSAIGSVAALVGGGLVALPKRDKSPKQLSDDGRPLLPDGHTAY